MKHCYYATVVITASFTSLVTVAKGSFIQFKSEEQHSLMMLVCYGRSATLTLKERMTFRKGIDTGAAVRYLLVIDHLLLR